MKIAFVLLLLLVGGAVLVLAQPFAGKGPSWAGPAADPARLEALVRGLVALGTRNDAAGQERAASWIRAQLGTLPVTEQVYTARGGSFRNLIVRFGPDTPERIVIGAHYDARGPFPGADDNASGTAALIELARMLSARPPPIRTELAFYSNEEYGLLGSAAHAKDSKRVRAMISLEMLGCFDKPQRFPFAFLKFLYPAQGDYIVVVGRPQDFQLVRAVKRSLRGSGAKAESIDAPERVPGIGNSDHRSFWREGVRAVMVTDTAWYRNPRYHKPDDTPETLDYARMARIADGIAAWASAP
ncbi:MAG: M28 family peptidase [Deltaproteobacteria bacterium]